MYDCTVEEKANKPPGFTMSLQSKIEWTDTTWNPLRGCQKISPGCKHCYAETFAERFRGVKHHPYQFGFDPRLVPEKLIDPLGWSTPKTVFVNSMSDLFQPEVPDEYIVAVAHVMKTANWHTYQVLTKRAERLRDLLNGKLSFIASSSHIWWGVSVEDKKYGLPRISFLREAKVPVRFLSIEPLLEHLGSIDLRDIHWAIVGGESGPGCRPMEKEWVVSILEQCYKAGVLFFFKQWGGYPKSQHGRALNGRTYDAMPQRSVVAIPGSKIRSQLARRLSSRFGGFSSRPLLSHNGTKHVTPL